MRRVWQAHGIGKGKKFKYTEIFTTHQEDTSLLVENKFTVRQPSTQLVKTRENEDSEKERIILLYRSKVQLCLLLA